MLEGQLDLLGNLLLFSLCFAMSATVDMNSMKEQIRNKTAIGLGAFCQFFLLPFLGFAMVNLLDMTYPIGIMVLVVTSSPGGSYSNWWVSIFSADLALSVAMTAISTILSMITLPLNLFIYANITYDSEIVESLDWIGIFKSLWIVISAIAIGLYASYRFHSHRFNMIVNQFGNISGLTLICFSAFITNSGEEAQTKIWSRGWSFYLGVGLPCVLGLIIATMLTVYYDLKKPERISVAVEACYQNVGIATSLALTMFQGNQLNSAMGVPFFYGMLEAVVVGTYCFGAWKCGWSKAPAHESICKVIVTSYEVLHAEERQATDSIEVAMSTDSDFETSYYETVDSENGRIYTTFFRLHPDHTEPKTPSGVRASRTGAQRQDSSSSSNYGQNMELV